MEAKESELLFLFLVFLVSLVSQRCCPCQVEKGYFWRSKELMNATDKTRLTLNNHQRNKAGYTAIRCVLAGTDSSFGQERHFCMVSTRV